ncbi:hypothetical protein [Bradyrhizobium sp. Leo121]|uniref:hypothetical protein n=1 Tax=Bradyrhizobium sp. Leo121 TaxID=1571195 RepID=UPI0013EF0CFA|nr:hypothetical protein [Bradyrhizobium sp. Leo121]
MIATTGKVSPLNEASRLSGSDVPDARSNMNLPKEGICSWSDFQVTQEESPGERVCSLQQSPPEA